ncbi:hypothetical protein X798_03967, partial [Onchocerca flexuosa]
ETGELSENDHSFQRLTTNFEKIGHRSTSEGTPSMPMKTEMRAGTTASLTLQTLLFIGKRQLLFIMEIRRSLLVVDAAVCLLIGTLLFFIPSIVAYFIFGLISMLLVLVHCSAETPNLIHPNYLKIAKYWCCGWLVVNLYLQSAHRWTIGDTVIANVTENIIFQIDSLISIIIGAAWLAFPGWLLHRQVRISLSESHEFCARFMGTDFLTAYVITNHALHWKNLGDRLIALDARILICALTFAAQIWSQYAYSEHWNGGHWKPLVSCSPEASNPVTTLQILRRIGEGGYGLVFQVVNMQNPLQMGAMKVEPIGMLSDDQILKMEIHVLKKLANKSKHACKIYAAGKDEDYYFLIMTLLSKSLCELRKQCPKQRFTLPTSVKLCMQCLEGIEDLHNVGFLHRDIKPSNFAMGRKPSVMRTVFMLDFGLARQYCVRSSLIIFFESFRSSEFRSNMYIRVETLNLIMCIRKQAFDNLTDMQQSVFDEKGNMNLREPRKTAPFRGTIRYCSINVHRGDEQGRHDDLWSLLYMTTEMILGTLPWRGMDRRHAEACKSSSEEKLISSLPVEFHVFLKHLKKLNYNHKPDYNLLRSLLKQILKKKNHKLTDPYDWEPNGAHASKFSKHAVHLTKSKASDEKFEIDKDDKSDMNTRFGIKTIQDEINVKLLLSKEEEDDEGASRVSGVSKTDDTLQKLDELK